jgi:hypothetical protein
MTDTGHTLPNPDDLLMGGGAPTCSFPEIGTTWKGEVVDKRTEQQRDFDTGKPLTWDDGNPRLQVVITLQTDERDPKIAGDDGRRRLFVKGQMLSAVRKAVSDAGAPTVELGGTLAVQYTGDGEASRRGMNPPKHFVAQYRAPVAQVAAGDLL